MDGKRFGDVVYVMETNDEKNTKLNIRSMVK